MSSQQDRRAFLRSLAAGAGASAALASFPPAIQRALAIPANHRTGTLQDVEHIVILTQENRSFDHYFGTLNGVRGFGDRFPIPLASGKPVYAFDGAFQYAHAAGEPVVEVGASYISGRGHVGATTGWGTADLWCGSDSIHPSTADLLSAPFTNGQYAIGRAVASLVQGYLNAQA